MNEQLQAMWTEAENRRVDSNGFVFTNTDNITRANFTRLLGELCVQMVQDESEGSEQLDDGSEVHYYAVDAAEKLRTFFEGIKND